MLPLIGKFKLNSSILSIGANGNSVIILDSNYHLYELNNNEFIFAKKIFDFIPQHQFSKACAVSMNGYIAIGKPKSNICEILYLKNAKLTTIKTLSWHKTDIYNIRFSRDGKYLVTGGEDGKVFIFRLPDFVMINILPPRPDYISNIHFGKIAGLVVYSSYDLQNFVFDTEQNNIIGEFKTNSVVEDIVFFDDDKKIFFICANGESGIYEIQTKIINIEHNYNAWLTRTGLTKDNNYAYIGARNNILSYLELSTNKPKFNMNLSYEEGISFMRVVNARLYIGFSNSYLQIFDLSKYEKEFLEAISNNNYKEAKTISDKNIALKTQKIYIDFMNKTWNIEFKKIMEIIKKDSKKSALNNIMESLEVFFEDENKKNEFSKFSANIGIFKEFNDALENRNYYIAYRIAEDNKILKQTKDFEKLENIYNQTFESAKKLLLEDSMESIYQANLIVKPFIIIPSKKDAITTLLRSANKFAQADLLFKNKKFTDYFKLVESFKEIKHTPNYQKAIIFGEQILTTINELETKEDYKKALELIKILMKFIPFTKIAKEKKDYINLKLEFLKLISKKEYKEIFNNIQKYSILKGSIQYVELMESFNKIFNNALNYSIEGKNEIMFNMLKDYFDIEFWKNKIQNIFNLSYLNQINQNIDNLNEGNKINWKLTLQSYVSMFNKNDELIKICSKNENILNILNKIEIKRNNNIEYLSSIIIYFNYK